MAVSPHYKHTVVYLAVLGGLLTFATVTIATDEIMPPGIAGRQTWFIDMMDSTNVKPYERPMLQLPEGVVSQNMYRVQSDKTTRNTPEGQALTHSYEVDKDFVDQGEVMYTTYCAPCHAKDGLGNGLATDGSKGSRIPVPGSPLVGDAGVSKTRSDGYLYLTIRHGSAVMPGYEWALDDEETWAIVEYLRTQPGGAYIPPQPAAAAEPADGAESEEG